MKALGNKSLSAILALITHILWWIEWISATVIAGAIITLTFVKKDVSLSVPVTFSSADLKKIGSLDKNFPGGVLEVQDGNFSFPYPLHLLSSLMLLIGFAVVFAAVIVITYQLKLIFTSFVRQHPFHELNIKRIKNIGMVLILFSFLQWLFNIALTRFLITHFRWDEGTVLTYNLNSRYLVTGLILIVMAEIFKLGSSLEEDKKLTI